MNIKAIWKEMQALRVAVDLFSSTKVWAVQVWPFNWVRYEISGSENSSFIVLGPFRLIASLHS